MNMHKRIRLTPLDRQEIWRLHQEQNWTIVALAREFRVIKTHHIQSTTPGEKSGVFAQKVNK